jgi:hypothetical protein
MDTQNVSAQLYIKQLPQDAKEGMYGCDSATYPYLSTCVDAVPTDANIENAFQEQLNLSEYYKSPDVFNTMKEEFMDRTMEGENEPVDKLPDIPPPPPKPIQPMVPVGPTDFLNKYIKSGFGSVSKKNVYLIIALCIIIAFILGCFLYKKFFK